jgi:chromosome segregation ATPase
MKKLYILTSFFLFLFAFPVLSHAEDSIQNSNAYRLIPTTAQGRIQAIQNKKMEIENKVTMMDDKMEKVGSKAMELKDKKEAKISQVCTNTSKMIDTRISRFDTNKKKHVENYTKMKTALQQLITKLKAKGFDTSKLETDLTTLGDKITKFGTDYAAYIAKLGETKNFTCGQSQGEFKTALDTARDSLKTVNQDAVDIRNFYQTTVRPDIEALKAQKPSGTPKAPEPSTPVSSTSSTTTR